MTNPDELERMRAALEELIDHADQCMARLDYHDCGMLGEEPIKAARAALSPRGAGSTQQEQQQ